uniref:Cytosol aminopeptidase domain-containing protein n=1 Tax=Astatotilapia calliptera TaxID=8154 RepID=A0A3P8PJB6_ASTCA
MCTSVQPIQWTSDLRNQNFDGIVLVTQSHESLPSELESLKAPLQDYSAVDSGLGEEVVVIKVPGLPGNRLVFASTGPVNRDYDDIRRFSDAAVNGIQRALKAGMQRPLLVCPPHADYKNNTLVAALGALHALYMPLEVRESNVKKNDHKVCVLGLWAAEEARGTKLVELANALENGRLAYRDIGGSDPERMAAPRVADYVQELFKDSPVKVEVVSDLKTLEKEYPCLAAVNRCANSVPRHQARVVKLQYCGEGPIEKTLMLVGKGITYDTGGADIKAGGVMAGMHRDKCGAAAVAGFFQIVAQLKPQHLKVVGVMAMVRNSVGADCYVADELVVSRAGRRVRVGNTDAEGRMVMVDLLCEMKEKAVNEVSPQLFTIATLTGHAIRAMGPNYSPERCWAICLRCLLSGARTMSSTRASLSTRTSCSATTCRPLLHLEDIRHLQLSSSWLQDLTSTAWIPKPLCRTPTLTSPGPAVLSQVYQQEPQSSPWQPTTYSLISKQRNLVSALKPCTNFFPSNYKRNTCYST